MKSHVLLCCEILVGLALGSSPTWASTTEIAKSLSAEVSVNTDGTVSNVVVVDAKVPAAIKSAIANQSRGWRFVPVLAEGVTVPAVTYVALDVCAIPAGDGYDLIVNYAGNGPRLARGAKFEFPPAVNAYGGDHLYAMVKLKTMVDGHAQLVDVVMVDVVQAVQHDVRSMIKGWVASLRFQPEQVSGKPVATDIEWPVEWFRMGAPVRAVASVVPVAQPMHNPLCQSARAPNDTPRVIDSPLKLQLTDAGAPAR